MRFSKFIVFGIVCCFYLNCNDNAEQAEHTSTQDQINAPGVSAKDIEDLSYTEYALSDVSDTHTANWLKFQELQQHILSLRKGDLNFFKDDKALLEGFMEELKTEVPEKLNETSILVRLVALETASFKLHDEAVFNSENHETLLDAIEEMLIAHTNLIFQINKKFEKEAQKIEKPT